MRHEFSHEYELTERLPRISRADPVRNPFLQSRPLVTTYQPQSTMVRGCISAAAFTLWALTIWSCLMVLSAVERGDGLVLTANFLKMILLGTVAIGLRRRYRWAVRLLLIACIMLVSDFVAPALLLTLEGIQRYITHDTGKIIILGTSGIMFLGIAIAVGLVAWWFWHHRRYFLPHPWIDEWGYRLYVLAAVVSIAIVVADVATTYRMMDELIEPQAEQFRELDRIMYELWS